MLISVGKVYTAFNLTPHETIDMMDALDTAPVIWPPDLYIDPEERSKHLEESVIPFSHELAQEYADLQTKSILKLVGPREKIIQNAINHLMEMTQILEKEDTPQEWNALTARWLHGYHDSLIYELVSRLTGTLKKLEREINAYVAGSYTFLSLVELEEVVLLMEQIAYPLKQEVKGLTRAVYEQIVESHHDSEDSGDADNIDGAVRVDSDDKSCEIPPAPGQEPPPKKGSVRRGAVPDLLKAIRDEAEKHSLPEKYFVTSDRTIRNWLNDRGAPDGFSVEVLATQEAIVGFAQLYVERELAKGSSELAANAKKEVALNPSYHAANKYTPEDAMLISEAYKDYANTLSGGTKPDNRRR